MSIHPRPHPPARPVWPWLVGGAAALVMVLVTVLAGVLAIRLADAADRTAGPAARPGPTAAAPGTATGGPGGETEIVAVGETIAWERPGLATRWTVARVEQRGFDEGGRPPRRGTYLLAYVEVVTTRGTFFLCDCTLRFRAADGREYRSDYISFADRPRLPAQTMTAGQSAGGWVPFDVPAAAPAGGSIRWTPDLADEDVQGFWRIR